MFTVADQANVRSSSNMSFSSESDRVTAVPASSFKHHYRSCPIPDIPPPQLLEKSFI